MRRLTSAALFVLLTLAPAAASAVTVDQIIALSKAGISEPIILALIERDKTVLTIDPEQLASLRRDGLSENVIVAMLKSGREEGEAAANAAAALNSEAIMSSAPTSARHRRHRPRSPAAQRLFERLFERLHERVWERVLDESADGSGVAIRVAVLRLAHMRRRETRTPSDGAAQRPAGSTASVAEVDRTVHDLPDQRRRSASGRFARLRRGLPARRALR